MALPFTKAGYKLQKLANGSFKEYPVATVAFYGPDHQTASKLVVGIIETNGAEAKLRKWFARGDEDLRASNDVLNAALAFINESAVTSVALMDVIIGCPHEEGPDYPMGSHCQQCTYWRDRKRPIDKWRND